MEPGGIEPPCRIGSHGASTRVVDDLISACARASTPLPSAQPPVNLLASSPGSAACWPARYRRPPLHRASSGGRATSSSQCVLRFGSCWFCVPVTRRAHLSTRHTMPYTSGRIHIGPKLKLSQPNN